MGDFLEILKSKNEPLYYFGLICLIAAAVCFLLAKTTPTQVMGTNAWYKPFKFLLSTTLLVWAMGWYMQYLDNANAVLYYSWGMIVLLGFEDIYIALQASRGMLSHFNLSTPFYASMYSLMAFASATIAFWTAYIGILFFTNKVASIPDAYLWGIRLGIFCFVIFSLQGFSMGARLSHTVGATDGSAGLPVVNWSKQYGDLRIAHFLGMHALQIIPLLSFYLARNVKMVVLISVVYVMGTTGLFLQALQGKAFIK